MAIKEMADEIIRLNNQLGQMLYGDIVRATYNKNTKTVTFEEYDPEDGQWNAPASRSIANINNNFNFEEAKNDRPF